MKVRLSLVGAVALLLTACATPPSETTGLSRAAVKADLAMWQKAGMDKHYRGRGSKDVFSKKYQRDYAEYQRLRGGPEYQEELQRQLRNADHNVDTPIKAGQK
ncbi:DUF4148 domain-containing protein [Achromobacter animicus]|uniref:DUF4148 domain-containing protein n=1 Tax=Achromobacter animicus TaxID=1389935 RepID=UPI002447F60A|nr:DUF4148 domain-containing protein [Achromobacter animicus]MDH0682751.1 DUF4148 domain-containing protein [Achromobacter animicus]